MKPTMLDAARRLPLAAAAGLVLVLAAAGCAGRTPSPTASAPTGVVPPAATTPATEPPAPASTGPIAGGPASTQPGRTAPAGPVRCHTADLTARLRALDSAAGQRYAALVLANRSTRTCGVYGYGGVQLLDAARRPLPTNQVRDRLAPPRLVLLRPGTSAFSRLHWGVVATGAESETGPCQPTPAYLLVTPPDETRPILVAWPYGMVCRQGRIEQTAYAPGTTPAN